MWAGNATILFLTTVIYMIFAIVVFVKPEYLDFTAVKGLTPLMYTIVCCLLVVTYY